MQQIKVVTKADCEMLESISAPTIEGFDIKDIDKLADIFAKEFGFNKSKYYLLLGKDMNAAYGLTGDNAYPDNSHIVSFDLDDFSAFSNTTEAAPYIKIRNHGVRWFDDIVWNNDLREHPEQLEEEEDEDDDDIFSDIPDNIFEEDQMKVIICKDKKTGKII